MAMWRRTDHDSVEEQMKLAKFKFASLTWPWWTYMWGGLMMGLYAGAWLGKVDWYTAPWLWIVPPVCIFIAYLPDAVVDIAGAVRRYREAAK